MSDHPYLLQMVTIFPIMIWPFLYENDCFSMMTWVVGFSVKLKWIREASTRVRKTRQTRVDQVTYGQTDRALSRHR